MSNLTKETNRQVLSKGKFHGNAVYRLQNQPLTLRRGVEALKERVYARLREIQETVWDAWHDETKLKDSWKTISNLAEKKVLGSFLVDLYPVSFE